MIRTGSLAVICVLLGLTPFSLFGQSLRPRQPVIKPVHFALNPEQHRTDVIRVKFNDGLHVRVEAGKLVDHGTRSLTGSESVLAALDGARIARTYTLSDAQLKTLQDNAQSNLNRAIADLRLCFNIYLTRGQEAEILIDALNSLDSVEYAMPMFKPTPLPTESCEALVAPDYFPLQDYLLASPVGIDAPSVWSIPGGTGSGVKIADVEYGWNFNHLDLPPLTLLGPPSPYPSSSNHGTAVLGEMGGLDDGVGVRGICSDATFFVVPANTANGWDVGAGIIATLTTLGAGDICLIEQQTYGPSVGSNWVPVEWDLATYSAIVLAVGNGVTVVEAAGNGNQDLDAPIFSTGNFGHYPFLLANDSGAILVGAGAAMGGSSTNHSRLGFSNYGATVDISGQGENVTTTGYGGLYSGGGNNELYTSSFSGTSSASPIVAGAVAILQGVQIALNGTPLTPAAVKLALQSTGTPQTAGTFPVTENIGPYPDIVAAIATLNLTSSYILTLSPASVMEAGPGFTLAATGDRFDSQSVLYFDGTPLVTTFMDAQNITALVPSNLVALAGFYDVTSDNMSGLSLQSMTFAVNGPTLGAAGGGLPVLKINGSLGGADRRVDIPVAQPITVSIAQPLSNPQSANFIVFGEAGVPNSQNVFVYPPVTGSLIVTPCQADPLNPTLFTVFTTFGPAGPCGGLWVGPAPFQFGSTIGLPFPLRMTIQGVIEESPGSYAFTNGIIINIF